MVQLCPRCQRANPAQASFCFFDGCLLRQGSAPSVPPGQLPQAFVFPSGKRCQSYDELAQACYAEWDDARAMLLDGTFTSFLSGMGRADLSRAAREAAAMPDHDLALTNFIASLPTSERLGPKLGLSPRRLVIGQMHVGEIQQKQVRIVNEGQGTLQGKVSIADGADWLEFLGGPDKRTCPIQTTREQTVNLRVDSSRLVVGQNYSSKLLVASSGGVAEVPIRLDLSAHPFTLAPYQGATSPNELARKMRDNPRPAVPLLENGEIARWFSSNGWTYPVVGSPAPGLASVQQFFEELGLARAPQIVVAEQEIRLSCAVPESPSGQIVIRSPARKLVYARAESDAPWLKVTTPSVSGQVQTAISFMADAAQLTENRTYEGTLKIVANAGQSFQVKILVEVTGNSRSWFPTRKPAPAATPRTPEVPVSADGGPPSTVRSAPSDSGMTKRDVPRSADSASFTKPPSGGSLPAWVPATPAPVPVTPPVEAPAIAEPTTPLGGVTQAITVGAFLGVILRLLMVLPADVFARVLGDRSAFPTPGSLQAWLQPPLEDGNYLRLFVLATAWLGAVAGGWLIWRAGGRITDLLCGVIAGLVAGLAASATLGCLLVIGDSVPRLLLATLLGERTLAPIAATPLWILTAVCSWLVIGAGVGLILGFTEGGKQFLVILASPLAGLLRLCGFDAAANFFLLRKE